MLYYWCLNYFVRDFVNWVGQYRIIEKNFCLECFYVIDGLFKKYGEYGFR